MNQASALSAIAASDKVAAYPVYPFLNWVGTAVGEHEYLEPVWLPDVAGDCRATDGQLNVTVAWLNLSDAHGESRGCVRPIATADAPTGLQTRTRTARGTRA